MNASETPQNSELCKHCETPLKTKQVDFCCIGCEFVFKTINGLGLQGFYQLRDSQVATHAENSIPNKNYDYLDDPELQKKFLTKISAEKTQVEFYLPTIHCSACIWLLEKLPVVVSGVESSRVSFRTGQISIVFNPESLELKQLAGILNSLGYPPVPADDLLLKKQNQKSERQALMRIGIAGLVTLNTMMFGDALFESVNSGMESGYRSLFTWTSALLTLPVVTYCALPFYRSAIAALIMGSIHLDLPISIAIIVTYLADIFTITTGGNKVYFDSIACLVFLLLLARYIQHKAVYQARLSVNTAWDLFPALVKVINNQNQFITKKISELKVADLVYVDAGERIPSDGEVVAGTSAVDMSLINGESVPREIKPMDLVYGGTINLEQPLTIKITEVGKKTRLGKIIDHLRNSGEKKTKLENEIDKLSRYFVIIVCGLAIFTYFLWSFLDPSQALSHAIGLLVITCPCALGLAIPATLAVAMSRAQKAEIFVKNSEALQILSNAKNFYLDKTGTLTSGKLTVVKYAGDLVNLSIAKVLSNHTTNHPVSLAVSKFCESSPDSQLSTIKHYPGKGVEGYLNTDQYQLGSLRWMQEQYQLNLDSVPKEIIEYLNSGSPILILTKNGNIIGYFILKDTLAPQAKEFINILIKAKKNIWILSGDSQAVVSSIAKELGLPAKSAKGELYPEQKAEIISKDLETNVMIGDGVNDALAMQKATLGIGLSGGIESTLESAGIFLGKKGLAGMIVALQGTARMKAVIRRNLIFSICYNIIGAGTALLGYVTPLIAAIMMPLSSLVVILSSILESYFKKID